MATMFINNTECTIRCVAPGDSGTGDSPSTAQGSIPAPASFTANTVYLFRRSTTPITFGTTSGTFTNTRQNIHFIGMPLPTDPLYEALPQEFKGTAWDSDPAPAATLQFVNHVFNMNFNTDFGLNRFSRIDFLIPNTGAQSQSNGYLYFNSATLSEVNNARAVYFEDVTFKVIGHDTSDPSYTGGYTYTGVAHFLYCNNSRAVTVRRCKFIHPAGAGATNGSYSLMRTYGCVDVEVTDCEFWDGTYTSSSNLNSTSTQMLYVANAFRLNMNRNKFTTVVGLQSGSAYCRSWGYWGAIIHNNQRTTYRQERRTAIVPTMLRWQQDPIQVLASGATGSTNRNSRIQHRFNDWDVDYGDCWDWGGISGTTVRYGVNFNLIGGQAQSVGNTRTHFQRFRNIKVRITNTKGVGVANVPTWAFFLNGFAVESSDSIPKGTFTLDNLLGGAIYLNGQQSGASGSTSYQPDNPVVELTEVWGNLSVVYAEIRADLVHIGAGFAGCFAARYGTLGIGEVDFDPSLGVWENQQIISGVTSNGTYQPRIFIDKCPVPVARPINGTGSSEWYCSDADAGVICTSEQGDIGRFKAYNRDYTAESWNVVRTGGAPSCYKITSAASTDRRSPINIGFKGFKNFRVTLPGPGNYILEAYLAFKAMTETAKMPARVVLHGMQNQIVTEGDEETEDILDFVEWDSLASGLWVPRPATEWSEAGLDAWRVDIPVTIEASNNPSINEIDVRLVYDYFSASGYCYFDPQILYRSVGA